MSKRVVALVPMRHDSERVPGKNYRMFAGRPLYHWVVDSLLRSGSVDEIVIDTDSAIIMDDAARAFPSVTLLTRPVHLRPGTVPMNEIIVHDVQRVQADIYLQTHSTNPLVRPETFAVAIERFATDAASHDSLFSVTQHKKRLWDASGQPMNHDPAILQRTQDLPPVYDENSCIYLFPRDLILATGNRIGRRPMMFELTQSEAWDIDEESDFRIGELLCQSYMRVQA